MSAASPARRSALLRGRASSGRPAMSAPLALPTYLKRVGLTPAVCPRYLITCKSAAYNPPLCRLSAFAVRARDSVTYTGRPAVYLPTYVRTRGPAGLRCPPFLSLSRLGARCLPFHRDGLRETASSGSLRCRRGVRALPPRRCSVRVGSGQTNSSYSQRKTGIFLGTACGICPFTARTGRFKSEAAELHFIGAPCDHCFSNCLLWLPESRHDGSRNRGPVR